MWCLKFLDGRMVMWGRLKDGVPTNTAPLVFAAKQVALAWRDRIAIGRRTKAKQCPEPPKPYWVFEDDGENGRYGYVDTMQKGSLTPGPIRHEALSPELEAVCRDVYRRAGHHTCPSYEQWEVGFLRDMNPDRELAVWQHICAGFERWLQENPEATEAAKVEAAAAIVALSAGADLPQFLKYYKGPVKPLTCQEGHADRLDLTMSAQLLEAVPVEEARKLAAEWSVKAMHKECNNPQRVVTNWGEVVLVWDWEDRWCGIALESEFHHA